MTCFALFASRRNAMTPDIASAHAHCYRHRAEVEASASCGCFYCLAVFPPSRISEWVDWPEGTPADLELSLGTTALCPECGIDSVIGSASGLPIDAKFLSAMQAHWF